MVQSIEVTCGEQRARVYDYQLKNLPVLWSAFEACGACAVPAERWDAFVNVGLPFARNPSDYVLSRFDLDICLERDVDAATWLRALEQRLKHPAIEALRFFGVPQDRLERLSTAFQLYLARDRARSDAVRIRRFLVKLLPRGMASSEAEFKSRATAAWLKSKGLEAGDAKELWRLVRPPLPNDRALLQAVVKEHAASAARLETATERKRRADAEMVDMIQKKARAADDVDAASKRVAELQPRAALAEELLSFL